MFKRLINPLKSQSFFLFGARGTGKSTLLHNRYGENSLYLDLLDPELEDRFVRKPSDLSLITKDIDKEWVILDEVQKVPKLLDVVHKLIESKKQKFILTGSSARKLKRGSANLLAGRANVYHLFPLTSEELGSKADLTQMLQYGSLPSVVNSMSEREHKSILRSYGLTYLKEEVIAEQLLRKLDPFRDFIRIAAEQSGRLVNFEKNAKQVGVDHKTVQNYFSVLEDTLLGFYLPSFHRSVRKSQLVSPKFYLFDLGVRNSLAESIDLKPVAGSSYYGFLFEHFVILECHRLNHYFEKDFRFSYLLTKGGMEIDLILSKGKRDVFIEIKSNQQIDESEVARLKRIASDMKISPDLYYVSQDPTSVTIDGVKCRHWQDFTKELFL